MAASPDSVRVACTHCGKRFRVAAGRLSAGEPLPCSGCGRAFDVPRGGGAGASSRAARLPPAVLVGGGLVLGLALGALGAVLLRAPPADAEARGRAALEEARGAGSDPAGVLGVLGPALVAESTRVEAVALLEAVEGRAAARRALAVAEGLAQEGEAGRRAASRMLERLVTSEADGDGDAALEARIRTLRAAVRTTVDVSFPVPHPEVSVEVDGAPPPRGGLEPGFHVAVFRRAEGEVRVPFALASGDGVVVACPVDPARVPPGQVYVEGGVVELPWGGREEVEPLLWDGHEVSEAQYAAFLDACPPAERLRRVPRQPVALSAGGAPLWERDGDRFVPPPRYRPVEGISVYDAKRYAEEAAGRLPTAAEWLHATRWDTEPRWLPRDDEALPVDDPERVDHRGLVHMAGNVAEMTGTLRGLDGETGWVVLGGSYRQPAWRRFLRVPRVHPGWAALPGVGFRLVRDAPEARAGPEEDR